VNVDVFVHVVPKIENVPLVTSISFRVLSEILHQCQCIVSFVVLLPDDSARQLLLGRLMLIMPTVTRFASIQTDGHLFHVMTPGSHVFIFYSFSND